MTTQYTPLLGLALPVTGELSGTWGDTVNDSITSLIDSAIAGYADKDITSGNWTLSTSTGAADESRMMILRPYGTPGVVRNIIAPEKSKAYLVLNTSDDVVILKGATTSGVEIQSYASAVCAWNGSDFQIISDMSGPATATDTGVAVYDGTTGKYLKNSNVTIDSSDNVFVPAQAAVRFGDSDSSNYVAFAAPADVLADVTWTLPSADGTPGQVLTTDGSATLSWQAGGGITAGQSIAFDLIFSI